MVGVTTSLRLVAELRVRRALETRRGSGVRRLVDPAAVANAIGGAAARELEVLGSARVALDEECLEVALRFDVNDWLTASDARAARDE
jgi:hypothetical protein